MFYVQGSLSIIWYVLWLVFVFDSPALHPRVSRTERQMIESSLGITSGVPAGPVRRTHIYSNVLKILPMILRIGNNKGQFPKNLRQVSQLHVTCICNS